MDASKEQAIKGMRYLFWHDALELMYTGGEAPRHPVAICLADAVRTYNLPRHIVAGLLDARENDPANEKTGYV